MKKVYGSAAEALDGLLHDGMFIAAGGFGLCGIPELLIDAIVESAVRSADRAEEIGLGHDRIILSAKVSAVPELIEVYRRHRTGQGGAPVLAAPGAAVTVFDNSPAQLDRDRSVAEGEGLRLETVEGFGTGRTRAVRDTLAGRLSRSANHRPSHTAARISSTAKPRYSTAKSNRRRPAPGPRTGGDRAGGRSAGHLRVGQPGGRGRAG